MLTLFQKALWFALFGIVLIGFADQEIRIANRPISEPQQRPHFVQSPRAPVEAEIKTPEGAIVDWVSRLFDFRLTDVLIVFFTALLASKTAGLYTETAALRSVADAQRGDLLRSIRAAENSAHAAQKSADVAEAALTIAERPYFVPREPKLKMYRFGQPGMPPSDPQTWVGTLEYGFLNMGRTVGFLKEATVQLIFVEELPPVPRYSDPKPLLGHYPVGSGNKYECPVYLVKEIDYNTFSRIMRGDLKPFFFGYVRYTDVLGYMHTEGFCFRFFSIETDDRPSTCAIVAGRKYNYDRTEKFRRSDSRRWPPRGPS